MILYCMEIQSLSFWLWRIDYIIKYLFSMELPSYAIGDLRILTWFSAMIIISIIEQYVKLFSNGWMTWAIMKALKKPKIVISIYERFDNPILPILLNINTVNSQIQPAVLLEAWHFWAHFLLNRNCSFIRVVFKSGL